jgi:ATP-dependent Zn protease
VKKEILGTKRKVLDGLADALIKNEVLDREDIENIIKELS